MKVNCPRHDDKIASCKVYEDHAYCFAGCGSIPLSEVGVQASTQPKERYVENLEESLSRIEALPRKGIRGFEFPCDDSGYYIVWPTRDFYKLRLWNAPDGDKYRTPRGHSQPLLWVRRRKSKKLIIVEGEINALSISLTYPEQDVVCPGSASNFTSVRVLSNLLTQVHSYETISLVVDRDPPGVAAAITAKATLSAVVSRIDISLMEHDANELLVNGGTEAVRKEVERTLC